MKYKKSDKWNIKKAVVETWKETNLSIEEQETHFILNRKNRICYVDSSNQLEITQLRKNPYFIVEDVLTNASGVILQVRGILPYNSISIRKKFKPDSHWKHFVSNGGEDEATI